MSGQLGEFPGMREAHYAEQRDAAKIALESFTTYHFERAAIMAKRLDDAQLEVKRLRELVQEAAKLIMVFRVDQTLSVHEIDPLLERLRAEVGET